MSNGNDEVSLKVSEIEKVKQGIEADLLKREHVHSVGIGYKNVGGKETEELAIVVFTARKQNEAALSSEAIIPKAIQGVKTDVVESPAPAPFVLPDTERYRPCSGGAQLEDTGWFFAVDGTLGAFVRSLDASDSNIYVLSNYHVLGDRGERRWQSAWSFFYQTAYCVTERGAYYSDADAAIAKVVDTDTAKVGYIQDVPGTISPVITPSVLNLCVKKRGRTTGLTHGRITAVKVTTTSTDGNTFNNQMYIQSVTAYPFSKGGDSGSLIITDDNLNSLVALLWGGTSNSTVASPIDAVFRNLNVTLA
jgi:predicted GIY-YIG superfamily endonuclease